VRRPGHRSYRQARQQRRSFVRSHLRLLAALTAGYLAFAAIVVVVCVAAFRWSLPFFIGGLVVGYGWFISWALTMTDGSFNSRIGALAEEWTHQEFKKLGFYVIDGIEFDGFDVDHVAVGPTGVFALETKWTSVAWTLSREGLSPRRRHAVDQAQRGARKIRLLLRSRGVEVAVVPVVVVWGPGARLMRTERLAETLLLVGTDAKNVLAYLDADNHVEPGTIESVREVLQGFVDERERYEARRASTAAR